MLFNEGWDRTLELNQLTLVNSTHVRRVRFKSLEFGSTQATSEPKVQELGSKFLAEFRAQNIVIVEHNALIIRPINARFPNKLSAVSGVEEEVPFLKRERGDLFLIGIDSREIGEVEVLHYFECYSS